MKPLQSNERGDGEIETNQEEEAATGKDQLTDRTWEEFKQKAMQLLQETNLTMAQQLDSSKQTEEQDQQQDLEVESSDGKEKFLIEDKKLLQKFQEVMQSTETKISSIREKLAADNKEAAELARLEDDKLNQDKELAIQMADAKIKAETMKFLEGRIRIWARAAEKVNELERKADEARRKREKLIDDFQAEEDRQAKVTQQELDEIEQEFQQIVDLVEKEKASLRSTFEIDDKQVQDLARIEEERLNQKIVQARLDAEKRKARLLEWKQKQKDNRLERHDYERVSLVIDEVTFSGEEKECYANAEKEHGRLGELTVLEDQKIEQERDTTLESIENERARIYSELEVGEKERCELARLEEEKVCNEALVVLKNAKEERDRIYAELELDQLKGKNEP